MSKQRPMANAIGRSVTVRGEVSCSEDLVIDGRVEGNVESESFEVMVAGEVEGNVRARQILILGRVAGDVSAAEEIEIRGSAQVEGDLVAHRLMIHEHARVRGNVRMHGVVDPDPPADAVVGEPIAEEAAPEPGPSAGSGGSSPSALPFRCWTAPAD